MDGGERTRTENTNTETEPNTNTKLLEFVGNVIVSINESKHVDQVIHALYSFAIRIFPLDSVAIAGSIDKQYRDEVIGGEVPSVHERDNWWHVFYQSTAFPTLARVLLVDVALNWLTCFPISAKKHLYDVFFLKGSVSEVVETLVPYLQYHSNGKLETSICSNTERLLALCLLENDGVLQLARDFFHKPDNINFEQHKYVISKVSQLVTSVPDKARLGASTLLSSHLYIKRITIQLIQAAEEWNKNCYDKSTNFNTSDLDDSILFIGDAFARICRRGSTDVLLSEMVPRIITEVQCLVQPGNELTVSEAFKSKPGLQFWSKIMEVIKDSYAVERISEQLLHKLATQNIDDVEGYWILWLLFHHVFELQSSIRSMFTERFLLWKLFPVCCLRWILQFSIIQCPPDTDFKVKSGSHCNLSDTIKRLLAVWSKRDFVQSAPIEQQAYLTAAVGLLLEKLNKEDLDATKDAMHLILQGVSCRLESPSHLVRKMANSIALVFSKVIDPSNPLYLDDDCKEENINWEFTSANADMAISDGKETDVNQDKGHKDAKAKNMNKEIKQLTLVDPDEVIDPATLNYEATSDVESNNDEDDDDVSETSSESSLQPYDLSDDDTDLKKNFSQLVDVVGALRKSDDADGVKRALDVAEKLIRAAPDELPFIASDLVRTLVQVRCSDSTLEGEEESAEEKRQKALIALIVNCPLGTLDPINKLLYSPNVDTSQRIMILDVMTDAALELAHTKTARQKHPTKPHILTTAESQPWFLPSSIGPAGSTVWKEISGTVSPLSLTYTYERDLPSKPGQVKRGKSRRWSVKSMDVLQDNRVEWSQNKFPPFAAVFMLPAMQGFDKKSHGVDFLGRDFIVLGKLIHMLGICMKCSAMHPEASALALPLLDMLSTREICHHAEAYVRTSVLFAASCILLALNPTYVASALAEGASELSRGLEWVRTWALSVAESDTDKECYTMAMACLHLHSEMALQTSRALESSDSVIQARGISLPSNLSMGKNQNLILISENTALLTCV